MQVIYATERVERFISSLDDYTAARVERTIDLLEKYGSKLGMPHSRSLGGGLLELRVPGIQSVRLLYIFRHNKIYIIHTFFKKTSRIPKKETDHARRVIKMTFA